MVDNIGLWSKSNFGSWSFACSQMHTIQHLLSKLACNEFCTAQIVFPRSCRQCCHTISGLGRFYKKTLNSYQASEHYIFIAQSPCLQVEWKWADDGGQTAYRTIWHVNSPGISNIVVLSLWDPQTMYRRHLAARGPVHFLQHIHRHGNSLAKNFCTYMHFRFSHELQSRYKIYSRCIGRNGRLTISLTGRWKILWEDAGRLQSKEECL